MSTKFALTECSIENGVLQVTQAGWAFLVLFGTFGARTTYVYVGLVAGGRFSLPPDDVTSFRRSVPGGQKTVFSSYCFGFYSGSRTSARIAVSAHTSNGASPRTSNGASAR